MTQPPYDSSGQPQPGDGSGQQPPYGGGVPGQPPYGAPTPGAYGQPPYGGPMPAYGGYAPPDHQQAMLVLILGIVGLVVCQLVSPFAWVMGSRVIAEIDASNGQLGGRSTANAGRICGIVGTVLIGIGLLFGLAALAVVLGGIATSST